MDTMGQKNYKRLYYNLLRSQENDAQVQEIPITEYPQPEIRSIKSSRIAP